MPTELAVAGHRVRLVRELGRGGTSSVWLARSGLDFSAVLKVGRSSAERGFLKDEAERLLSVDSSALARLLDAGLLQEDVRAEDSATKLERGLPFIALEWAAGESLDKLLQHFEGSRTELALAVARDVAEALADLHAAGCAHGDVKPANIVVVSAEGGPGAGRWRARLIDLGLSGAASQVAVRGGTVRYLAPEVLNSSWLGDARARDLWALGLSVGEIVSQDLRAVVCPADIAGTLPLAPEIEPIVNALLARVPGVRPSAAWVRRRALLALGLEEPLEACIERRKRAVRRAYVAVRRHELAARGAGLEFGVQGAPEAWLREHSVLLGRIQALAEDDISATEPKRGQVGVVQDLDALGRSQWLVKLVGPEAARWPALSSASDAELAERLLSLCEHADPQSFTLSTLELRAPSRPTACHANAVELALALGSGAVDSQLLDAAEDLVLSGAAPDALGLALGRCLRLRGELGRALTVLEQVKSVEARIEAAEAARRAGDKALARGLLEQVPASLLDGVASARRSATLARILLDEADPSTALALLAKAPEVAATLETRALAEIALGARTAAASSVERARVMSSNEEERARIEAVAGTLAHAAGDSEASFVAFRHAAEHAARAGAVLEEATYLTGLAAAATNVGELGQALEAAQRSTLLFEHLGRAHDAARAALARANVYVYAGARDEAREAGLDALAKAKAAKDSRCEAYAHLALADVLGDASASLEHARQAAVLLENGALEDRLWVGARLLKLGGQVAIGELDSLARKASAAVDARLDWWGARALVETARAQPSGAALLLAELNSLIGIRAPCAVLGSALAAGSRLAARAGEGEMARRLTLAAGEAARELLKRAPPELRAGIACLDWVSATQSPRESAIFPEQVADVETLVRALGRRDRLRPLLDQVLDALVLWTGVERGLLLLRAPGDRLVPRAARNLARSDLGPEQLALSRSLAARALAERETVVAMDAVGELPELHASVHALKLRSVLAVPLLARGEALGVVYLDDRVRRGAFGPRELAWVRLVATLAAVAIADARDQLLLRRATRRAQRSEARLAQDLAAREAQLHVVEYELARTRDARETRFAYDAIVGKSEAVRSMLKVVDRVTLSEVPVLISGESGSGKESIAEAIHQNGPRAGKPFVSENCAAIPESLLESALFGHVRGAFTGASRPRAGLFEVADGGTLFLDEIAEMSVGMQTKLLRVLEEGELRPVGSERARRVNVRVICATHRDLEAWVKSGAFREDLFYRLNVIAIRVPPLRERNGDIPLLVRHFIDLHAQGRRIRVARAVLDALGSYAWPGNIRQLENEVRRALVLADDTIEVHHLSPEVLDRRGSETARSDGLNVRERVDALEVELVRKALQRTDGNQTKAAELLGLSRFGLQKMMKRLEITLA